MKKHKLMICSGIFCILFSIVSSWYAITFNDSRLVAPMDFDTYVFQINDLPMILAISLVCIYCITLFVMLILNTMKRQQTETATTARKLNPKLGLLGLLGFLGFTGFWSYPINGSVSPFVFFTFFGFFGFYYEGKLSDTLMDERFRENAAIAQLKSYKIVFSIILIALLLLCQGKLLGNLEYTLIALIIVLSLTLALGMFLPQYLLYHYDHDEPAGEREK